MTFNSVLDAIKTYEAGKPIELVVREFGIAPEAIVKLASNENPFGVAPAVVEVLREKATIAHMYPDDSMHALKGALAAHYAAQSSQIVIGAGSDQVIEMAIRAKATPADAILIAGVTFAMYEIYAKQIGVSVLKTPTPTHDLAEFLALYRAHREQIAVLFLCLPNNPLGECLDQVAVYDFLEQIDPDTLVVVDGAYQEYARFKDPAKHIVPSDLIARFPNTLYLGTFSKAYGLGGMRVGYGIAQEEIITALHKLRPPFNITTLSLAAAVAALEEQDYVAHSVRENFEQMRHYEAYARAKGIRYIESYTNFITLMLEAPLDSTAISHALLRQGIIVRNLASYGLNALRITIGSGAQNERLFAALDGIIGR